MSARGSADSARQRYARAALPGLALVLLVSFPLYGSPFHVSLLTTILIYAVFAMSLDVLMGYTGLPSFGHAAFFGVGGYAGGLLALHVTSSLWAIVAIAVAASATLAVIIGFLAIRSSGVYFIFLTFALAQLVFTIAGRLDSIGGTDGLPGIPRPTVAPLPDSINFFEPIPFAYLTMAFFLVSYVVLRLVLRSPFGLALVGIRENEQRMRAIGYPVARYKLAAFVVAGLFGGLAGAFFVSQRGFVSPDSLSWLLSGVAMVMVIIGGAGTLIGPAFGAAVYVYLQDVASSHTDRWQLIFGMLMVGFIVLARGGLVGLGKSAMREARKLVAQSTSRGGAGREQEVQ